ncbi:hypothetical protein [Ornithinibacillus halotolerans]|uniref:hypothetical protein n=1 Tax=Ornithinibacillus halotolerans TaxID=1274357 RepID=UPI001E62E5E4|nr:hypothetical protein [Ornithinibacillus halotolerans]
MIYDSIGQFVSSFLFWWIFLLIFQRLNRYPKRPWIKDILLTIIQALIVLFIFLPLFSYFLKKQ